MAHFSDLDISQTARNPRVSDELAGPLATTPGLYRRFFKRGFDVAAVLLLALMVLPLLLVFGALIRLDGGPAFYSQPRVGRNGRIFRFWKLRTMTVDAERRLAELLDSDAAARAEWITTQKLKSDPRITPLGRILRKTSLDELPQLWNVFRGDMSLVGPRPMMPSQTKLYPGHAYYALRPGLTGFWQISDRNESSFASRAAFDTDYSRRLSFLTDMLVLAATAWVVVRGTGY
jgi:lipopolysaccharide/colanic/teichoic acid biosynthesis glycosyltransferase